MSTPLPPAAHSSHTLGERIQAGSSADNDALLGEFLEHLESRRTTLYPAQETAILELFEEKNVILNTPTGSGKSLVATALHFKALAQGKRSVYTCPIKALVNEKWAALCREFGPQNVGLSTGDATVNRDAPILCCTAEVLANIALREGARAPFADVIMDEFHYYADAERGVAWQIPLLTLPQSRFLLLSATLGETAFFEEALSRLNGRPSVTVRSANRPVPLEFEYSETPLSQTLESLLQAGKAPVYVVHFTQLEAARSAQDFTSLPVASREEKAAIAEMLHGFKFSSLYGPEIKKWLRHGIGLHHAGLLPKYRILVEQLAQKGLLKVICGTDTLGVGINVPIRSVLLTQLCKFGGKKNAILSARDFHQITGRAGRKGFDDTGWVVAQAPEHVIENLQRERKQAASGKKFVKKKAPEKNFTLWDRQTFQRLIGSPPERLTSSFKINHGMLLNVLSRPDDGVRALRHIIRDCHETPKAKRALTRRAWQLFRALHNQGVVQITPRSPEGARVRVNIELQDDFSMNQTLSLFLIETLPLLDAAAPDYALRLLTLVESILENPEVILRKQLDRIKTEAVADMKSQGIEYDQRMEELEKLEYPKPDREFIYSSFNAFAEKHPWVGGENIRPKSIVREMFEEYRSFSDYIHLYELHRAEGLLLRHISSVHKVLAQTVPVSAKTEAVLEMEVYLSEMIRQVDSSLLDQWEKMQNPDFESASPQKELRPPGAEEAAADVTRDIRAFTGIVRARIFRFLRSLSSGDCEGALAQLHSRQRGLPGDGGEWTAETLRAELAPFYSEHERIRLDPEARNLKHTHIEKSGGGTDGFWRIEQMLVDPDEANDWVAEFSVDLAASKETADAALTLRRIGALG